MSRRLPVLLLAAVGCVGLPKSSDVGSAVRTVVASSGPHSGPYPETPSADPLALAADCLGRGDRAAAVGHLERHVRARPDEVLIRVLLADLLYALGRHPEARAEYERFVAAAQPLDGPPHARLTHCHTRLMAIAGGAGDSFAENLHRGIGLYRLASRPGDDPPAPPTLAKAAAALRAARDERPADARVNLYLFEVYGKLGQRSAARAALAAARAAPPFALTPAERERLLTAE